MAERAFIMVWDGLRPDFVSAEVTPNLWRLARHGVWFERSYAVYPTLTRANSPAISTGCRPGRAGVPGNSLCIPVNGSLVEFTTGDAANLQRLSEADGRPILLVDTLADRVHRAGGTTVVVGAGSPGSAFLQHPRANATGDLVIARGLPGLDAVRTRFGAPPALRLPATAWDAYFTRLIAEHIVPALTPTLLVFWHTDPDHTNHALGHVAPESAQALRDADDNLGTILDSYDHLGLRSATAVVVTSDHGSSSITRRVAPARDVSVLAPEAVVAENGGSTFVYSTDPAVVPAMRELDYLGPVFSRDGQGQTFPLAMAGLAGPRSPDIVFSLAWSDERIEGVAGAAVGTHGKLVVDHGTISPYDLRNTLVIHGSDFRSGWRDGAPVGNIDIAPTLTHVLRLDNGTSFDGRVLSEALRDASPDPPAWRTSEQSVSFSARGKEWTQRVWFEHVGSTSYLAKGAVEPA